MKKYLFFWLFVLFTACSHQQTVERISVQLDTVHNSLFTRFPGSLLIFNDYIILGDPFAEKGFVKIFQRHTGAEINAIGIIGKGQNECLSPDFMNYFQDHLVLYDFELNKKALIPIDSLIHSKNNPVHLTSVPVSNIHSLIQTGDDEYVAADYLQPLPFHLIRGEQTTATFGKNPVDEDVNTFTQGQMSYHPLRKIFVYTDNRNPYIALYKRDGTSFSFEWECQIKTPHYRVYDNAIHWEREQPSGIMDATFSKDYIVCLLNELKIREVNGREIDTAPKAIYLFDYDGQLVKILDLPVPAIRIASAIDSNVIYIVELEPDYDIVKCDLSSYGL
ncbi:MAG: hypothetical protein LBU62_09810 [Bacteroidales bacterium]|jgi:hypothetical protein|nr:hypothetical protein [Bacteroidales bacterium]